MTDGVSEGASDSAADPDAGSAADSPIDSPADSPIDALFGDTQFKEYETGLIPTESPFAARAAAAAAATATRATAAPGAASTDAGLSRTQKVLISVGAGLVAVLALAALFFLGTRLPTLLGPAPAVAISSPSPTPTPTSTAKAVGPVAPGVHPWDALLGGECLNPYTSPWAETFTVVDCGTPHPAQMVFRGTFATAGAVGTAPAGGTASASPTPDTEQGYPGADALQAQISLLCAAPGVINLAAAGQYTDVQLQGSYAVTEDEWNAGEHDYFCFVSRSSGQPLTGSVAVPTPAAPAATAAPAP